MTDPSLFVQENITEVFSNPHSALSRRRERCAAADLQEVRKLEDILAKEVVFGCYMRSVREH